MSSWIEPKYLPNWVSVIIPTYNRRKLLYKALESVHKQSYRPIECMVVDDGSSDDTAAHIAKWEKEFGSHDFTIVFIPKKNGGAPSARNVGTRAAKGEFIQYLDSDDLLYPLKLSNQVDYLQQHPSCDGVFGNWDHGTTNESELVHGVKEKNIIAQFYGGRVIHTLSFLFRRRMVNNIGPWDEGLKRNQEVDFNLRGVLAGGNFDYQPITTGLWREHPGERIVSSNGAKYALQFHQKWIQNFQEMGIFDEHLKQIAANHIFTKTLDYKEANEKEILNNLYWVNDLNPNLVYFSTSKMKLMKTFLGSKKAIKMWYKKYKQQKAL